MDDRVIDAEYRVVGEEKATPGRTSIVGAVLQIAWSVGVVALIKWAVVSVIGR